MTKRIVLTVLTSIMTSLSIFAQDITSFQYMYIIKQVFPKTKEISIFISKDLLQTQQDLINRACAQQQFKAIIYEISNSGDIGRSLKQVGKNDVLLLFPSEVVSKKLNKLYILSKCKEKKISLVTSIPEYSDSGCRCI